MLWVTVGVLSHCALQEAQPKFKGTGMFVPRVSRDPKAKQQDIRQKQTYTSTNRNHQRGKNRTTAVYMPFGNQGSFYPHEGQQFPFTYWPHGAVGPQLHTPRLQQKQVGQLSRTELGPRSSSSDHSSHSHSSYGAEHTMTATASGPAQAATVALISTQQQTAVLQQGSSTSSRATAMPMQAAQHSLQSPVQAVGRSLAPSIPAATYSGASTTATAQLTQLRQHGLDSAQTAYFPLFSTAGATSSSSAPYKDSMTMPGAYSIWGPLGQTQQQQTLQHSVASVPQGPGSTGPSMGPGPCNTTGLTAGQLVNCADLALIRSQPGAQAHAAAASVFVLQGASTQARQGPSTQALHQSPLELAPGSPAIIGASSQGMVAPTTVHDSYLVGSAQPWSSGRNSHCAPQEQQFAAVSGGHVLPAFIITPR